MNLRFSLLMCLIGLLLVSCGRQSSFPAPLENATGEFWPTSSWRTTAPETQGVDPAKLKALQTAVKSRQVNLDSLLIIRNGWIISETYYNGQSQDTLHAQFSVTKSFISTLIGIAFDQGKLSQMDQRVLDLLPGMQLTNLDADKQAMTLEHLLTMSSGLDWTEGDPAYRAMYMSSDWVKWVMDEPMRAAPGKEFNYCSGCSHVLSAILQQQTGLKTVDYGQKYLLKPLGINHLNWEKDAQGIAIGGWGLELTARDMAKLGYLYLHQGMWQGKQVVSSKWVQAATTKHVSTDGPNGYGYQWWTYPSHNAYMALGRGGQTIFVAPDLNLIVVTTANLSGGHEPIFGLIDDFILPAVED